MGWRSKCLRKGCALAFILPASSRLGQSVRTFRSAPNTASKTSIADLDKAAKTIS